MASDNMFSKVRSSYNFLSDTITFRRSVSEVEELSGIHGFHVAQSLSIVNIRRLNFWNVSKIEKAINKDTVIFDFLNYESFKFGEVSFRDISNRVRIVIKSRHVKLIQQVLRSQRDDLGIGLIFLLQAITSDEITDSSYLEELLENQAAPNTKVLIDDNNLLYAYPYYSSIKEDDVVSVQDSVYSTSTNDHIKKNFPFGYMSNLQMMTAAFLCQDDENLSFGDFLKKPTFTFDSNVDFCDSYSLKSMVFKYCNVVPFQELEILNKKDLANFAKALIGVCDHTSWIFMYGSHLKESYDDMRKKLLEILFEADGDEIMRVLRIFRELPDYDKMDFGHALYANIVVFLWNIMYEYSINDADEFVSAYVNAGLNNDHIFLNDEILSRMLVYFESERTVSFEMWLYLNDFMVS